MSDLGTGMVIRELYSAVFELASIVADLDPGRTVTNERIARSLERVRTGLKATHGLDLAISSEQRDKA